MNSCWTVWNEYGPLWKLIRVQQQRLMKSDQPLKQELKLDGDMYEVRWVN